ncbi:MAG: CoA transferase, partial [Acidimicrobiia bacterium]|nr:CoA transferase [Acidimicrobiia bacterium]
MGELLEDLRVVDLTGGHGRLAARVLADLGAQVVRVGGAPPTREGGSWRIVDGVDLGAFVRSAGVDIVERDPATAADRAALHTLLDGA